MSTEDKSREEFEAWTKTVEWWDFNHDGRATNRKSARGMAYQAWQASRRTYRASVLEEAAQYLDGLQAEQKGRCNYYAFAANGVRALAAKTQEEGR